MFVRTYLICIFFFFNDTATTEIYTLSLHDALPISLDSVWYCASLTFSIQSTALPLSCSCTAMCVTAVVGAAPCQCFSPGGIQITSPGRISSIGPPQRCARPEPAVTISVWPSGGGCQAVRAPGSNVTLAPDTRAGSGAWNSGSMRTVPVNHSAGPMPDGCEPLRLMSMWPIVAGPCTPV